MQRAQDHYPQCPEPMIVTLARSGDRNAFTELVRRRQSSIRHLMRRCCNDNTLADDLAQQVFLQVWLKIHTLKRADAFGGWLRRLAISVWLQHQRRDDALSGADELTEGDHARRDSTAMGLDLDQALATLPNMVRLCIVLSYQQGMSHGEISELIETPLGTVKSHILRGTRRLQQILSAYRDPS